MSSIRVTYSGLITFVLMLVSIVTGLIFTLIVTRRLDQIEFGLWSLIGGIIGALIGFGLAGIIGLASGELGLPLSAAITPEIFFGALLFAMIVGMISGIYPARKAAKLDPVDAIRFDM